MLMERELAQNESSATPFSLHMSVCLFTGDIPFTTSSGGTATAVSLLAQHLVASGASVTVVGIIIPDARSASPCDSHVRQQFSAIGIQYDCLHHRDFVDNDGREVIRTHYWEAQSLAVLRWLDRNHHRCQLIHGHEWGGVFAYLALVLHSDPLRYPNTHLMIIPHGGHMWSRLGADTRPADINAFRVDHLERLSIEWADSILSPSRYMLGYFTTRGWRVEHRLVIPNIIDGVSRNQLTTSVHRPVWQLCFVGRLEDRKGIKIFWRVLMQLNSSLYWQRHNRRIPLVRIIGSPHLIENTPSLDWLAARIHTQTWNFPITVYPGLNRSAVLEMVQEEGVLLVVPSIRENLPYVLAEAAALRVPTVTFAVGGSREVLHVSAEDMLTFCNETTVNCMYEHILSILCVGWHHTPTLSPSVIHAPAKWTRWHRAYQWVRSVLSEATKFDDTSHCDAIVEVLHILPEGGISTDSILQSCTAKGFLPGAVNDGSSIDCADLLLILPLQYEIVPSWRQSANDSFGELFAHLCSAKHLRSVAAVTFGVEMDDASISYASAPTWLLYGGDINSCERQIPLLVRREALCKAFSVDSLVFPLFEPWMLADVLGQQGMRMITHPSIVFRYRAGFSIKRLPLDSNCQIWAVPLDRYRDALVLDHLHRDVSDDVRNAYYPRRSVRRIFDDLTKAIRTPYLNKADTTGRIWSFENGSISQWKLGAIDEFGRVHWFTWYADQNRYGCNEAPESPYPFVDYNSVVHPCLSTEGRCCRQSNKSITLLQYTFSEEQTMITEDLMLHLLIDAAPTCGDGVHVYVYFVRTTSSDPDLVFSHRLAGVAENTTRRTSQSIRLADIQKDSRVSILFDPVLEGQCDQTYVEAQIAE